MSGASATSPLDWPVEIRESEDAGHFYCGHALYCAHYALISAAVRPVVDEDNEPLWGFLHVPPGVVSGALQAGHGAAAVTPIAVTVAAALAGYGQVLDERTAVGDELYVALSGFGPFRDVEENPTGRFVTSVEQLHTTLELAFSPAEVKTRVEERGLFLQASLKSGRVLHVVTRRYEVDDRFLELASPGSLFSLLEAPTQAWLGLGVCRDPWFRVETHPHDGGLALDARGGRHEEGRPVGRRLPPCRALMKALGRGREVVFRRWSEWSQNGLAADAVASR